MPAQNVKINPIQINLIPSSSDFSKTSSGKIFIWALTVGRYIVVFTELIVIMAFIARFTLDRQLTDLHDSINQKKAIIDSAATLEADFRNLQKRLVQIETIEKSQVAYDNLLMDLARNIPVDVAVSNLTLDPGTFKFSGQALSEAGLATLTYQLRNSPKYSNIDITDVRKVKDSPLILFNLAADYTPSAFN